jgi:hypothetical protein
MSKGAKIFGKQRENVGKMGAAKPVLQFKLSPIVVSHYVPVE